MSRDAAKLAQMPVLTKQYYPMKKTVYERGTALASIIGAQIKALKESNFPNTCDYYREITRLICRQKIINQIVLNHIKKY